MATTRRPIRPSQPAVQTLGEGVSPNDVEHRAAADLATSRLLRPNILILGAGIEAERALEQIRPALRAPLASWFPTVSLQPSVVTFRSLIVRDVECLTAMQQATLATFLDRPDEEVQIISIARAPLFPLVRKGRFLDGLYYRLNVVLLEPGSHGGPCGW